jgi:D-serine deaminase-like pyridoxal phosphate-dependent protein
VWKDPRWQPTPERGAPEALAELLAGPLRFVWFLDAEDAADPVADL